MLQYYNEIMLEYSEQQRKNAAALERRKAEVYTQIPRIESIDKELSEKGLKAVKAMLDEAITDKKAYVQKLHKESNRLKAEKSALLNANGYSDDYLEEKSECLRCHDTGFVGDTKCACFSKKLIDRHVKSSGLSQMSSSETFSNFKLSYYSSDTDKTRGISPRDNMKIVLRACEEFCKNIGKSPEGLLLMGKSGLGKTFLCNCIANRLLAEGRVVLYQTASQLFKIFEDQISWKEDGKNSHEIYELLFSCDLLVIDDLGTEYSTRITDSEFFNLINLRQINGKPIIISTNLNRLELANQYSERVASRIAGNSTYLDFFGDDVREIKKYSG